MKKELKNYVGIFILGVLFIIIYKTFDNIGVIWKYILSVLDVFTPIVGGCVVAYILYPLCKKPEKLLEKCKNKFVRTHRRGIAVALVYLGFILFLALILIAIIPMLIKGVREFITNMPSLIDSFINWINSVDFIDLNLEDKLNSFSLDNIVRILNNVDINKYASGIMGVGTSVFRIFMSFIISVYILLDRASLKKNFERISNLYFKSPKLHMLWKYAKKVSEFIYKYLYCLLIDAMIVFIMALIVLSILRVPYAFVFAFLVGICNIIPYFGAIIATVLTALVTVFTVSFARALIVVAALIAIQQLDANLIQPRLYSGSFNIRPIWVIVGILIGGGLFGIIGILLAVPIMAVLAVIFDDILTSREHKRRNTVRKNNVGNRE